MTYPIGPMIRLPVFRTSTTQIGVMLQVTGWFWQTLRSTCFHPLHQSHVIYGFSTEHKDKRRGDSSILALRRFSSDPIQYACHNCRYGRDSGACRHSFDRCSLLSERRAVLAGLRGKRRDNAIYYNNATPTHKSINIGSYLPLPAAYGTPTASNNNKAYIDNSTHKVVP